MDGQRGLNAELDAALVRLRERAAEWASLPLERKIALLAACRNRTARCAEQWGAIAAEIKGVGAMDAAGEELLAGPWGTMRAFDAYMRTLRRVQSGQPRLSPSGKPTRPDGSGAVRVFPNSLFDRYLLPGVTADVWLEPNAALESDGTAAGGRVVAVMGAGNVTSIGVLDLLSKLVNENAVSILKVHPLLRPLLPVFNDVFAPLIDEGFVATTSGDAAEGAYLCSHPLVDAVHVTGSTATYGAIAAETDKPLTAELGNVTPAIVMGGRWSSPEIDYVAESLVSAKLHNNGYDCIALQVLILPAQWDQRDEFVEAIERVVRSLPQRSAYYPGFVERFRELAAGRSALRSCGNNDDEHIAPTIVGVEAHDTNEPLFTQEAFCPLLAVTTMDGEPVDYLRNAVRFCNEQLAGDLAAHIIARPTTLREYSTDVEAAIDELRYGCVGVNLWTGVGFLLPEMPWGAAPGNTPPRIRSGVGMVHNAFDLQRPRKTILRGPFFPLGGFLRPPWFVTQRNALEISRLLCTYERRASLLTLARIACLTIVDG